MKDAERDLAEFKSYLRTIRAGVVVPSSAPDLLEQMIMSAAWHAANTRKGFKEDADMNLVEFEMQQSLLLQASAAAAAKMPVVPLEIRETGLVIEPDVVELIGAPRPPLPLPFASCDAVCCGTLYTIWSHLSLSRACLSTARAATPRSLFTPRLPRDVGGVAGGQPAQGL